MQPTKILKQTKILAILITAIILSSGLTLAYATSLSSINNTVFQYGNGLAPYSYLIYTEAGTCYARNGITGAIDYSSSSFSTVLQDSNDNLFSSERYGTIFVMYGIYTLDAQIVISSQISLVIEHGTTIKADSLAANAILFSSVSNNKILGGRWKSNENYMLFDIINSANIEIAPDYIYGKGGGVYAHGESADLIIDIPYAYQLGKGASPSNGKNGVAVYTEELVDRVEVKRVIAYDSGTVNSWTGGMYGGTNIHVGYVLVKNCYGGGVGVGFENHPCNKSSFDTIIGETLNTDAMVIYHATGIQVGLVQGISCGMVTAPYEYEPAFTIYGDSYDITVDQIIAEKSGGSGVIITTSSNVSSIGNVKINSIISRNNGQKAEGVLGAGLAIQAANNGTITDLWIGSVSAVDTQSVPTQKWGLSIDVSAVSTWTDSRISSFYASGNTVAEFRVGTSGTATYEKVYLECINGTLIDTP